MTNDDAAAVCAFVLCSTPVTSGYCPEHAEALRDASVAPHPTILRRAVLLCSEAAPEQVIQCDPMDGICPVHDSGACPIWYVPWADAQRGKRW